jgi:O-antigen/teichoic acid export membrane protein
VVRRGPSAVLWSAIEAASAGVFSLTSAFIVARIVGPAELGVGAAAVSLHILFWVGVNAFFADAMVQRATLNEEDAASAFWASTAAGVLAGVIQAALGVMLARAIGDTRLVWMAFALGATLPATGAAGAVQGMLTRNGRYKMLAYRTLVGQGAGMVTGISLAACGAGAWAVAAQQLVTSVIGAAVLLVSVNWRPRLICRWSAVRELVAVGGPLTASTLVLHGRYRMFAVVIGGTAGAAALGEVHLAFRLVDTVRELISTALWRLMLPAMSERQGSPAALRACSERWLAASGTILFPLCAGMLVSVGPLTRLLLGPVWSLAGVAAMPLVLLAAWNFLLFPAGVSLVAVGQPGIALRANAASCIILLGGVLASRPATIQHAVWLWLAAQLVVGPYTLLRSAAVLRTSVWHVVRAGVPVLAFSVTAAGAALLLPMVLNVAISPAHLLTDRLAVFGAMLLAVWLPIFVRRYVPAQWWGRRRIEPTGGF